MCFCKHFKCLPVQRMEHPCPLAQRPLPPAAHAKSRKSKALASPGPPGTCQCRKEAHHLQGGKPWASSFSLASTLRSYRTRTKSPETSTQMSSQPGLVLFQAVLPNWWQWTSQQCQPSRNWFLQITRTYTMKIFLEIENLLWTPPLNCVPWQGDVTWKWEIDGLYLPMILKVKGGESTLEFLSGQSFRVSTHLRTSLKLQSKDSLFIQQRFSAHREAAAVAVHMNEIGSLLCGACSGQRPVQESTLVLGGQRGGTQGALGAFFRYAQITTL